MGLAIDESEVNSFAESGVFAFKNIIRKMPENLK